jgi:hypothetical protein
MVAMVLAYRYWIARDLSDIDPSINQITLYQEQKIAALKPGQIDTVFLGDSALGNAINAALFDKLTGTRSVNLALTGSHGHAGALIFLQKIAKREPSLKRVILFFSVDALAWGLNKEGRFYMSPSPWQPGFSLPEQISLGVTYVEKLTQGQPALEYLKKVIRGQGKIELPLSIYTDDYIVSHAKIKVDSENVRQYHLPKKVLPKSTRYLSQIGVLCRQLQLQCIYVQGPIMAELISGNTEEVEFFDSVKTSVATSGIALANDRPFLMKQEDRGDSIFHVSPDARDRFTRYYAQLLKPLLSAK